MQPLIDQYRKFLPVTDKTPVISLGEGNTPLLAAPSIGAAVGARVYLKFDGANPTGSFKDRGMTLAVSKAVENGAQAVICASTGNTAASAAAYAVRAGIKCVVILPAGKVAMGKLAHVALSGATIISIGANFDRALELVRELADQYPIELVNSVNPYRIAGQATAAYEIVDELEGPPDYHALPVGNAGNITAYWKGYNDYRSDGKILRLPKMLGFQAAGAAPIVLGKPVTKPETIASAIRIGNPASWQSAETARDESGGLIEAVTDDEILAAYRMIACEEGVFCEPASAAGVAGILKLAGGGFFKADDVVVCTLTGHGLKDPQTALENGAEITSLADDSKTIAGHLGL